MSTHSISGNVASGAQNDIIYLTQPTGNEGVQLVTVLDSSKNYTFSGLADNNTYILYTGKAPLVKILVVVSGSDISAVNFN